MRLRLPSRLSWKLLVAILPLVILAVSVIVWLQYNMARRQIMSAISKETQFLAQRTAAGLDELLDQRLRDLLTLAETPLIADYYRNVEFKLDDEAESYRRELERYLLRFAERTGVYAQILYLDRQASEVCAVRPRPLSLASTHARADYFLKARAAGPGGWWASSIEPLEGVGPVVYFSKPIHDELREFKGVLVLCYKLSQLHDLLKNVEMGRRGRAYIRAADGRIMEGRPREGEGQSGLLVESNSLRRWPWAVIVEAPLDDFLGPLRKVKNTAILTSLLGLTVLVAILLFLVRSLTRPIAELAEAARRIGRGELSHRIRVTGGDELSVLSSSFNEMAENLETNLGMNQRLQQQLIQAEKLSAVGQLISAVAHELNNPLQAVSGYVQHALHEDCSPQIREDLGRAFKQVFRCSKIVNNLLFFVRQSGRERRRVDLNEAVESALELLEYRLRNTEEVRVEKALTEDSPEVVGDFQQIVQVIVNLIGNACDAMRDAARGQEGKRLRVRTSVHAGKAVIEIEDNGSGVPAELIETIFQPFFTTKEAGRGTGLGLPICRQIVRDHGGDISAESSAGKGSVFRVVLPVASEADLADLEEIAEPEELPPVPGKRVLVADDEVDIADLMARVLREDGDEVDVAHHGAEALKFLEEGVYDLVVSDIGMPHAKGSDLYERLSAQGRLPATKTLFVTGDILKGEVCGFISRTGVEHLDKPFDLGEFQQAVRRLLSGK